MAHLSRWRQLLVIMAVLVANFKEAESQLQTHIMGDNCDVVFDMVSRNLDEVLFALTDVSYYYPLMNCELTVTTSVDSQLIFEFLHLDLDSCADSVRLYDSIVNVSTAISPVLCESTSEIFTSGSLGIIQFQSDMFGNGGGFEVLVSSFKLSGAGGDCPSGYHECTNKRCIKEDLACNGRNNCGDNSDEATFCVFTWWVIMLICLGVFGIIVIAFFFVLLVVKSSHKKQSRSTRVDVMQTPKPQGSSFDSMQRQSESRVTFKSTKLPPISDSSYHAGRPCSNTPQPVDPNSVPPPAFYTQENTAPHYLDGEVPGPAVYNPPPLRYNN